MRGGVLHSICEGVPLKASNTHIKMDEAKKAYIHLMAHLFGRRTLPTSLVGNEDELHYLTMKYPSTIVLPPLPKAARRVLEFEAKNILEVFTGYAKAFTASGGRTGAEAANIEKPSCTLPLSGHWTPAATAEERTVTENSGLTRFLHRTSINTTIRSPFVANSGLRDDDYGDVQELADTVCAGLHLNAHAIPSFDDILSSSASSSRGQASNVVRSGPKSPPMKLNAYLLDFYIHGQAKTIVKANGIRQNDMWYLLEDFRLTLLTVKATLERLLLEASADAEKTETPYHPKERTANVVKDDWDDDSEDESDAEDTTLAAGSVDFRSQVDTLVDGSSEETESDGEEDDSDDDDAVNMDFKRPPSVTDKDWMVYRVVSLACAEFDQKAKDMWA